MEHLYVCHFSNGHIKVGRSVDPASRIASHAERVSCAGIELIEFYVAECNGYPVPCERALIERCAFHADRQFKNEWFSGLQYEDVCLWAAEEAGRAKTQEATPNSFGSRLAAARRSHGISQSALGMGLGVGGTDLTKASISSWELGNTTPNVHQLRLVCERLDVSADYLIFGTVAVRA